MKSEGGVAETEKEGAEERGEGGRSVASCCAVCSHSGEEGEEYVEDRLEMEVETVERSGK